MKVSIDVEDLVKLKNDLDFYESQADQYRRIRNNLAGEVNFLLKKFTENPAPKYEMIETLD